MNTSRGLHWTVHLLGIAGILGITLALRSIWLHDSAPESLVMFDLVTGLAELAIAVSSLCSDDR